MTLQEELNLISEGKHFSYHPHNKKIASKIIGIDNGIYIVESIEQGQGFSNTPVLLTRKIKKPQIYWEI
jgi:hypothetical protein